MSQSRNLDPARNRRKTKPLMVRLDQDSKSCLERAARLRCISVSDYVRTVTVAQARHELQSASRQIIAMTPEEQLTFWQALSEPVELTPAQRELGKSMQAFARARNSKP